MRRINRISESGGEKKQKQLKAGCLASHANRKHSGNVAAKEPDEERYAERHGTVRRNRTPTPMRKNTQSQRLGKRRCQRPPRTRKGRRLNGNRHLHAQMFSTRWSSCGYKATVSADDRPDETGRQHCDTAQGDPQPVLFGKQKQVADFHI